MFKIVILLLVLAAIIAIGVLIFQTCSDAGLVQKIDKSVPDVTAVPFEISTRSHIYYAEKATLNEDKSVTMFGWYERFNGKWVAHAEKITLPAVLRPQVGRR